jgi:hypothetical protein
MPPSHYALEGARPWSHIFFSKKWTVLVKDEDSPEVAKKLIAADPDKYLVSEIVTSTEYKNQKQTGGWGTAVKEQIFGSNGKR